MPVPLKRRDVSATVYAAASFSDTKETLSYVSDVECSAVFRFPLPPRAAVYRFRAVFGDREVVTKVKPRAAAREEFDLAVSQGHSAVHMAQHEAGASVFEVSLGNLEAHTEVTVEFSYLRLLDAFGGTLEWSHTATWVPPYVGSAGDVATGVDKVASSLPTFAAKVTYVLSYEVTVRAEAGTVRAIDSPEPVAVERPAAAAAGAAKAAGAAAAAEEVWRVRLPEQVADPSKDLTLAIELDPKAARRSGLRVQRTPASRGGEQRTVALATFVPPLPSPPAAADGKQQLRKEIWFVVDCSGSMSGRPINQAREAALFFVRDLPVDSGVRFNMTVFGSSHNSLYDSCKPYDSKTEKEAVAWIQNKVHANLGGTEILKTLESIYLTPIAAGYSREVIFLTDGGISGHEEERIIKSMVGRRRAAAGASALPQEDAHDAFGAFAYAGSLAQFLSVHPPGPAGTPPQQQLELLEAALQSKAAVFREYDVAPPHRLQSELQVVQRALGIRRTVEAARRTHVLCMGIGHGVHRGVLDGMAAASDGEAVYVSEHEGIAAKAAFLKKIATGCHGLVSVRVRAGGALVRMAPHVLPQRVFAGEPLHVLMEVVSAEPDAAVELTAEWAEPEAAGGAAPPLTLSLPLGPALASAAEEGESLPVLHAMAYIGSLMAGTSPLHVRPDGTPLAAPPSADTVKEAVVRLAVAEHLVTPHTSAVGVSLRRDPAAPEAAATVVEVPLQLPHGRSSKMWGTHHTPATQHAVNGFAFGTPAASHPSSQQGFTTAPCFSTTPCAAAPFAAAAPAAFGTAAAASSPFGGCASNGTSLFGAAARPGLFSGSAPSFGPAASLNTASAPAFGAAAVCTPPMAFGFHSPSSCNGSGHAHNSAGGFSFASAAAPTPAAGCHPFGAGSPAAFGIRPFGGGQAPSPGATSAFGLFGAPPAAAHQVVTARTAAEEEDDAAATVPPLLSRLNLQRTTEGYWVASAELALLLGQTSESLVALHPRRPEGLTDDAWATVIVLAVLRRCLAAQREVWADMEAKALGWLAVAWPEGGKLTAPGSSSSVGGTLLTVAKALERLPKV